MHNQWLLCAEQTYTEHTHGIKVINLLDDYVPKKSYTMKKYVLVWRENTTAEDISNISVFSPLPHGPIIICREFGNLFGRANVYNPING